MCKIKVGDVQQGFKNIEEGYFVKMVRFNHINQGLWHEHWALVKPFPLSKAGRP